MAYTLNRDVVTEAFRLAVLDALDRAALEVIPTAKIGATDADLPRLFRAIDAQINSVCEREGVVLVDYPVNVKTA